MHTASDGTKNELGNLPPAWGNPLVGAWHEQGSVAVLTNHVAWVYDPNNNYMGPLLFTEKNTVTSSGLKYVARLRPSSSRPTATWCMKSPEQPQPIASASSGHRQFRAGIIECPPRTL